MRALRVLIAALAVAASSLGAAGGRPKLVVAITVDQFRYDYLERFGPYQGGLARLLREGAVFTNAYLEHAPTVTAAGHAVVLTGAPPAASGIVGNEWYDRSSKKQVTSVSDEETTLLGASGGPGASPRRLLAETIGDELKKADPRARVIGVSLKDRSAILPAGRSADGAFWYDAKTGSVVSSSYYFKDLPAWVKAFNARRYADRFAGAEWKPLADGKPLLVLPPGGPDYYSRLAASPFGNELVVQLAEAAIDAEKLGRGPATDLLAVSLSANDYVGHRYGPDSEQVKDVSLRTDLLLGEFFQFLDARVGLPNVLIVLTSDHGVAPIPELRAAAGQPGGRIRDADIAAAVEQRLAARYGEGRWVVGKSGPAPYLNHELAAQRGVKLAELRREAAEAVRALPHIARVYTAEELAARPGGDEIDRRVRNGYHPERSADLFPVAERYWVFGAERAGHGSPYDYDAHVPVIFWGSAVKAGRYERRIAVNEIAPTLAALVGVKPPRHSTGRALAELVR
jgi:predicted AlkP superfamily pyrophosphatase or phosphodiesterase